MSTKINWTDETWNPIIGCEKISPGCKNCYAEKMAYRLAYIGKTNYYKNVIVNHPLDPRYGKWKGKTHFAESQLEKPLKWKKPRMIFVCSMGDLFHESVKFEWIDKVMEIIKQCPQHTFQILTKRPFRMKKYFDHYYYINCKISNIWLGATIENQDQIKRAWDLLKCPAKIHFVSVEPMLEEIFLWNDLLERPSYPSDRLKGITYAAKYLAWAEWKKGLDWIICGGESGHNARPMHPDWVRSLKDQCDAANVPFFFKQGSQNNWETFKDFDSFPEDLQIRQMP